MQASRDIRCRLLQPRLDAFPALYLQLLCHWREQCGDDVAQLTGLLLFHWPVRSAPLDAWIDDIHALWREHFRPVECYDGVVFQPQRAALLKRPVLALFQHRHVVQTQWLEPPYTGNTPCPRHQLDDYTLLIRFYGRRRDVERMKQRTRNVVGHSHRFQVRSWHGRSLLLQVRLPFDNVSRRWPSGNQCLDCDAVGRMCPLRASYDYPAYDFILDGWPIDVHK